MTKKQKYKQTKKRDKNRLRLRYLWPRMTKMERADICKQMLPDHLWSAHFWERAWPQVPGIWQSDIGRAIIPRHSVLAIAEREIH